MGEMERDENPSNDRKERSLFACSEYQYVHVLQKKKQNCVLTRFQNCFYLFQLESFDKNKDGEIELSEMAKLVSLCSLLVLLLLFFPLCKMDLHQHERRTGNNSFQLMQT